MLPKNLDRNENHAVTLFSHRPKRNEFSFDLQSGFAINSSTYLNDCMQRKLIIFVKIIKKRIFRPNNDSSHYAKIVTNSLRNENIKVQKEDNPANCPEGHPIENFWSPLKGTVYNKG